MWRHAVFTRPLKSSGLICALTPLEVWLRRRGGETRCEGGFIEHYVTAALYPTGLTREVQLVLGTAVLALNALVYFAWWRRRHRPMGRSAH